MKGAIELPLPDLFYLIQIVYISPLLQCAHPASSPAYKPTCPHGIAQHSSMTTFTWYPRVTLENFEASWTPSRHAPVASIIGVGGLGVTD